ncbi:DUF3369 domain-containing protein [Saccharibacillus sp. CPCC 101409]|uniref:HD domain-containing phosphohydrolase n=1 Tax=Saccharibacillus sp. CPCC 101409 TaxID=3058041 RepID=UPI002673ED9F|nr:HD domain-containing phosphohydrolase [Saccharibacillus sp. CPCC 101409]MDO3409944.1 DUF3369 domain-containing protein [Saccharibacillus sp. CPCC 101409]
MERQLTKSGEREKHTDSGWNVLLVSGDRELFSAARSGLAGFEFEGKKVNVTLAESEREGRQKLADQPDMAVVLLDLGPAGDCAALELVEFVRGTLSNAAVRIVALAGEAHFDAEEEILLGYEIDGLRPREELEAGRLRAMLAVPLRAYRDFKTIEREKKSLEYAALSSSLVLNAVSPEELGQDVLRHLASILNTKGAYDGIVLQKRKHKWRNVASVGKYTHLNADELPLDADNVLPLLHTFNRHSMTMEGFTFYSPGAGGTERLIFIDAGRQLGEWEQYLAEAYCTNTDAVFENLELRREIENTQKEIIYTLGEIAETRSKETGFHVKRVAEYTKLLALKYGLPEEEAKLLELASPMHDIGKVGISDSILNKPGKLTEDEYRLMQTHALSGYEMLKHSNRPILKTAAIIALQHHEKYGGGGYPHGLRGEEIHLYGRITAIADVFDALASDRVYKKAWPLDEIVELFERERGRHFDPVLTDLFLEHLGEFLMIRAAYMDEKVF